MLFDLHNSDDVEESNLVVVLWISWAQLLFICSSSLMPSVSAFVSFRPLLEKITGTFFSPQCTIVCRDVGNTE